MDDINNVDKHKPGIWIVSQDGGQAKRVLRPSEVIEILKNIDVEKQGLFKRVDMSNGDAQRIIKALLYTGMRLHELIRLLETQEYDNKLLFDYYRGTIFMPKSVFGDKGKGFVVNKERTVFLSYKGRENVKRFLDKTDMPRLIYQKRPVNPSIKDDVSILNHVLNDILKESAKKAGLPTRTFNRTIKKVVKNDGIPQMDEHGKPRYQKIQRPMKAPTTGIMCRSYRSTYESWLVSQYVHDSVAMMSIAGSFGHEVETAQKYYVISGLFDSQDLSDIKEQTEGWGVLEPKKEAK